MASVPLRAASMQLQLAFRLLGLQLLTSPFASILTSSYHRALACQLQHQPPALLQTPHAQRPLSTTANPMSDSQQDLQTWAQTRLTALYESTSEDELTTQFDRAFASGVEYWTNYERQGRDAVKDELSKRRWATADGGASVKWGEVISVPKEGEEKIGIVAGFVTITRSSKFRIRAAPAQRYSIISFHTKIESDSNSASDEDPRRIVHFFETHVERTPKINLVKPNVGGAQHEEGGEGV